MMDIPYKQRQQGGDSLHPGMQLLIFAAIFIGALLLGNIIGAAIAAGLYGLNTVMDIAALKLTAPHDITALWILQIAGTTLPILAAPVVFAYLIAKDAAGYIKPAIRFPWVLMLLIPAIMFTSAPLMEFLSNLNQKMVLPPFLKWMRDSEDNAEKLTAVMLNMKTLWDLVFNLLVIGLLTAIAEEFMFRGVLQTILVRWTRNYHAAIWIAAILFSAFHIEFFGFLPRLLLGVLFGYFVAWSGNIWTAVWAHFLNNGTDVMITYLSQRKLIGINPDDQHIFNPIVYILSLATVVLLMLVYKRASAKGTPAPTEIL